MNQVFGQVAPLSNALERVLAKLPPAGTPNGRYDDKAVRRYCRAIGRKGEFACVHLAMLKNLEWDKVEHVGRIPRGTTDRNTLDVKLSEDATLRFGHSSAVIDHVFLAFDGLIAALANMTDTFARLLVGVYWPRVEQRGINIFAVKAQCDPTGSLGQILHDQSVTFWLERIRDLRGECQHAAIEQVLTNVAALGQVAEPLVPLRYSWKNPQADTPAVQYAVEAATEAERVLSGCMAAVAANPDALIKP